MIGMMNIGHEESIEFYSSARPSSIFDRRKISKDTRSYMEDGRIMVNGVPLLSESPDELWSGLIHKMVAKNMVNQCVDKPGAFASLLRRLSSKISGSFSRKSEKSKDKEPDEIVELADDDDAAHITRIQILTQAPRKEKPQDVEDRTILNRLMREKEALERSSPKFSRETDRGHYEDHQEDHRVVIEVDRL